MEGRGLAYRKKTREGDVKETENSEMKASVVGHSVSLDWLTYGTPASSGWACWPGGMPQWMCPEPCSVWVLKLWHSTLPTDLHSDAASRRLHHRQHRGPLHRCRQAGSSTPLPVFATLTSEPRALCSSGPAAASAPQHPRH